MLYFVIPKALRDENPAGNFYKTCIIKVEMVLVLKLLSQRILAFISPERNRRNFKSHRPLPERKSAHTENLKVFPIKMMMRTRARKASLHRKILFASEKHIKIKKINAFCAAIKESII